MFADTFVNRFGTNTGGAAAGNGETCTLGEMILTAATVANGTPANGQLLPINQNTALFSLLGTNYGGNGVTTFALPDMRAVTPNNMTWSICDEGIFPLAGNGFEWRGRYSRPLHRVRSADDRVREEREDVGCERRRRVVGAVAAAAVAVVRGLEKVFPSDPGDCRSGTSRRSPDRSSCTRSSRTCRAWQAWIAFQVVWKRNPQPPALLSQFGSATVDQVCCHVNGRSEALPPSLNWITRRG